MNFNPVARLKAFFSNAKHILTVSYKPSNDEFRRSLKIVIIGILILGILGFVISEILAPLVA